MSTIDILTTKKKQYYNLLDKTETTKQHVDDAINHINNGIEMYKKSYTIEDKKADNNVLENIYNNLSDISKRLSENITKINKKISSLNRQINQYYEDAAAAAAAAAATKTVVEESTKETTNSTSKSERDNYRRGR